MACDHELYPHMVIRSCIIPIYGHMTPDTPRQAVLSAPHMGLEGGEIGAGHVTLHSIAQCHIWALFMAELPHMGISYGRADIYDIIDSNLAPRWPPFIRQLCVPPPLSCLTPLSCLMGRQPCSVPIYGHMTMNCTHMWPYDHVLYPYMVM